MGCALIPRLRAKLREYWPLTAALLTLSWPVMLENAMQTLVQYVLDNTRKPYPAANLECRFSSSDPQSGIIGAAIEGWRLL